MLHKPSSSRLRSSAGLALGPILFLIAILAVIAAVVSAGAGGFSANTSTEGGKITSSAIIQMGENLLNAVRLVNTHGCADTQINFNNPMISGYSNPNAPSDGSCDVFGPNGGGMIFPTIKASTAETEDNGYFVFEGGGASFVGLGNAANSSLAAFLPIDSSDLCNSINQALKISGPLAGGWYEAPPGRVGYGDFLGVYNQNTIIPGHYTTWNGYTMGCLQEYWTGYNTRNGGITAPLQANYFFFVVLLIR
jgi:hypothetical protein